MREARVFNIWISERIGASSPPLFLKHLYLGLVCFRFTIITAQKGFGKICIYSGKNILVFRFKIDEMQFVCNLQVSQYNVNQISSSHAPGDRLK